jgi:diguanylate cyclase (GGDEF)-like protein
MSLDEREDFEASADAAVAGELVVMLELLASTIVQALGFGVACINITRADGSLEVVAVAGDDDARRALLGAVRGAETWDRLLSVSEPWGLLRFADHRNEAANVEMLSWVPDTAPIDAEDAWHPEDALYAPLTASDGSRLGTLSVDLPHDGRRPSPTTRKALEAFAISAALAIEHAALRGRAEDSERRYRHLAAHDSLTGVGNRSLLLDRLEHALTRRVGAGSLLSVVFIDLDKFKPINDGHSHDAGDHVLKVVASRITALVRPHDTIARWGGDEFLILLENLEDEVAALAIAQRIVAVVATPIRRYGEDLSVTASVGVAVTRAGERIGVDELVRRADASMYAAKRAGGNACAVFPPVPTPEFATSAPGQRAAPASPESRAGKGIGRSDGDPAGMTANVTNV